MERYQEALDKLKNLGDKDLYNERYVEWANILQEFVDQHKPLTLEECIKEWEDDGYVFDNFYDDRIALCDNQSSKKIIISKNMKLLISSYYKEIPAPLSFKEIERILRTIKAKGWEI